MTKVAAMGLLLKIGTVQQNPTAPTFGSIFNVSMSAIENRLYCGSTIKV